MRADARAVLVVPGGSPFRDALEMMRPALQHAAADADDRARRDVLVRLQGCGLYGDVVIAPDEGFGAGNRITGAAVSCACGETADASAVDVREMRRLRNGTT